MNILTENLIPNTKAKDILEEREKEAELKHEQRNALEVLRKFSKIDSQTAEQMIEDLKKVEKLRDRQIVSIVNFLPEDREDLRAVLGKDYSALTDEEIDSTIKTVKKYI